jgi:hypothetical protein
LRRNLFTKSAVGQSVVHNLLDALAPMRTQFCEDFLHLVIALAPHLKLLHDEQHFRLAFDVKADVGKLLPQSVEGGDPRWVRGRSMQGDKLGGNQLGEPLNEVLLGREVVVQGRDIDAGSLSHGPGAQPFETGFRDHSKGCM